MKGKLVGVFKYLDRIEYIQAYRCRSIDIWPKIGEERGLLALVLQVDPS